MKASSRSIDRKFDRSDFGGTSVAEPLCDHAQTSNSLETARQEPGQRRTKSLLHFDRCPNDRPEAFRVRLHTQTSASSCPQQHPPPLDAVDHSPLRRRYDLRAWPALDYWPPIPNGAHRGHGGASRISPHECLVERRQDRRPRPRTHGLAGTTHSRVHSFRPLGPLQHVYSL